jgi:hypothetical protein
MYWLGADAVKESNFSCIPNVPEGTNNITHKVIPTINPVIIPRL